MLLLGAHSRCAIRRLCRKARPLATSSAIRIALHTIWPSATEGLHGSMLCTLPPRAAQGTAWTVPPHELDVLKRGLQCHHGGKQLQVCLGGQARTQEDMQKRDSERAGCPR